VIQVPKAHVGCAEQVGPFTDGNREAGSQSWQQFPSDQPQPLSRPASNPRRDFLVRIIELVSFRVSTSGELPNAMIFDP
jgi:hypothetical protein